MEKDYLIESEAAANLLDSGVSFPLPAPLWLRIFGKKTINVVVKRPTLSVSIMISKVFLSMGIQFEKLDEGDFLESHATLAKHGKEVSRIVAMGALRSPLKATLASRILAFYLRNNCDSSHLSAAAYALVLFSGVGDFMNIIRLLRTMTIPMSPNLSQTKKKGS